jgi:tetratricopeptide (TPR) repeat protein
VGINFYQLGDVRRAIEIYNETFSLYVEIRDKKNQGVWLGNLGLAYADLGDARKAIEFYEQQRDIASEMGDRKGEGSALFNMGVALHGLDEKDRAIDLVKGALKIYEAIESPTAEQARNTLKKWGALE